MTTLGDSIREQPIGQGIQPTTLPDATPVPYTDFSGGLNLSVAPENLPPNASPLAIDVELDDAGALVNAPGITQLHDVTPHVPKWIFEHTSIDPESRLVAVAPPYLGVKGAAEFVWTNHAISALGDEWTGVSAIGELLLSNGVASYHRTFAGAVTDISSQIAARVLATAFGRVFAGAYWAGGQEQSLGIKWNTASNSNSMTNWTTDGAGGEFLLADQSLPDRIMGMKSLGFDVAGILNRHSLWAAYPTGVANRPADFRPRFSGIGCVSQRTIATTPQGILFLSDEGVALYDINNVQIVSQAVNRDLLPLDYDNIDAYSGAFDPFAQRYVLTVPGGTWVYELSQPGRQARWFFRSAVVDGAWFFALKAGADPAPPSLYYSKGTLFGVQSGATNFGTALTPRWRTPEMARERMLEQFTTIAVDVQYATAEAAQTLDIWLKRNDEAWVLVATKLLTATGGAVRRRRFYMVFTGLGISMDLRPSPTSSALRILRAHQYIQHAGHTGNA